MIIYNKKDKNVLKIINAVKCKTIAYDTSHHINLGVPGYHNQQNASATLELARVLKIPDKIALKALSEYKGVWRRFQKRYEINGTIIIDDYAHHPTEIQATLQGAKEKYPDQKIIAIFQPHQYERTRILFDDFTKSFGLADQVIITDVYSVAGREKILEPKGKDLAKATPNARYVAFQDLPAFISKLVFSQSSKIKKIAQPGQIILLLGAGDIYNIKIS